MEDGWSLSPPSAAGILTKLQTLGFCSQIDASDDDPSSSTGDRLCLFDRILMFFMKEVDRRDKILPLPALLGDGQPVDLFKLYCAVGEKGGFPSVSADRSWESVATDIGLDAEVGFSLKLVYFKYLGALNPLLQKVLGEELSGWKESLSSSVGDSEAEAKGSCSPEFVGGKVENRLLTPVQGDGHDSQDGDSGSGDSDDVVVLDPAEASEVFSSRKRKREAMAEILDWVLRAAKSPGHPSVGWTTPRDKSEDRDPGVGRLVSQALVARKMMLLKNAPRIDDGGSPFQKRQKVHPSMYEDNGIVTSENHKVRCSTRIRSLNVHHYPGYCSESGKVLEESEHKDGRRLRSISSLPNEAAGLLFKDPQKKRIPVGPSFQVKVPEWNGKTCGDSDDKKWLGTLVWPLERKRQKAIEEFPVGRGRQNKCECEVPGSVECIRSHVAERRLQLKFELGSAFHDWGFDNVGEEAAISWSEDEERRFKAMVRLNPPALSRKLLDHLLISFPYKGRQNLVSYYFNVFLLRRRIYQNRATPNSIDSDDEEIDHEFLSRPFSQDAVKVMDTKLVSLFVDLTDCSDTN